jgi:predicted kinase
VAALGGQAEAVAAYLARAEASVGRRPQLLLICHGFSGSGKSHHSAELIEPLQAIRLRSDVERKRLFGLWGQGLAPARHGDPYAPEVSEELFTELLPAQAAAVLAAGFNAIVDATFLRRIDRQRMAAVAAAAGVPLLILDCQVPEPLLRQRIAARRQERGDPSDADLAVLERQLALAEPLSAAERQRAVVVAAAAEAAATVQAVVAALAALGPVAPPHPPDCAAPLGGSAAADAG